MVPLILFIVFILLTFVVGCFVVGSVVVEARHDGRPMLPDDPRPEPALATAPATTGATERGRPAVAVRDMRRETAA